MKCCSNCEWSISPELEDEIKEEQRYDENDPNRPHAGDCVIGMKPNKNYYCDSHQYIQGMEEENILNRKPKIFHFSSPNVASLKALHVKNSQMNTFSFLNIQSSPIRFYFWVQRLYYD